MMKQTFTRIACLIMALMLLVSSAAIAVSASSGSDVTEKDIFEYIEKLDTISYAEYRKLYKAFFDDPQDCDPVILDVTSEMVFVDEHGNKIEISGDSWKMTVPAAKAGDPATVYTSVEDAVAAGYKEKELVYVAEFDGKKAVHTPDVGSATWTFDLEALGITEAGLYSIDLLYYPEVGKPASIEREFYINDKAPFAETRALSLSKIWSSLKPDETSPLTATYEVGKKESADEIVAEALEAGVACEAAEDGKSVVFTRPTVITQKIYNFVEKYDLRFFITDAENNELRPTMVQTPEWTTYSLHDSEGYFANNFGFVLDPSANENGTISFTLEGVNEQMAIAAIVLRPYTELQSYEDYKNDLIDKLGSLSEGTGTVKIEAEYTSHTSTNVVYPIEDRTSPLTSPSDTTRVMLNTIGTEKWATAGQWAAYDFVVDGSGMYEIYARYKQSYLDGMYVNRALKIYNEEYATREEFVAEFGNDAGYYDGTPFAEAAELRYDYGNGWQVTGLGAGHDADNDGEKDFYQLYFREGVKYTVRLEVTLGSMSDLVQKIEEILLALNEDYLNIIKLTGTSPDEYRNYHFSRTLPDTLIDMMERAKDLEAVSIFLKETAGVASTYSGTCDKLEQLLRKMARDEDEIAKNLDNLKGYVGNLGTFLSDAKTQPLQLDYITIQPASEDAPRGAANFFQTLWHEISSFVQSFFRDYNSMGSMAEETEKSIDVWVAYGRDQSQVIRNLCTNEFTPEGKAGEGIAVDLKLITGSTLLPSILAGMGPDVYIGLADSTVINYAIRGALTNVEDMDGFATLVDAAFTHAAMIQLEISDPEGVIHTYGLPETQTFQMMFVRLDILADLELNIPKTWNDIYTAQSVLESHNMEIGLNTNYKIFLYQTNGDLYADDGMRINLDSPKGLAAFEKMCSLFTQHSFPYTYNAANRFRTGEMPIILADYTGLYNQLKVFATEIEGSWTFVPCPGTIQADGSINNTADSTINAVVMIEGIEDEDSAWKFMKWYTGAECQKDYANEMVAIIGDSAKQPTANRLALESLPWTREEFVEVSKQFENLAAIPNYPGSYYIDRHTNFAFLAAYNDDADPTEEILSYINAINNEITRKREEFKLETLEIGQTLADKRMNQALNAIDNLLKYDSTKYNAAIEAAKRAVANVSVVQLDDASLLFSEFLSYNYIAALNDVEYDSELSNLVKNQNIKEITDVKVKAESFYINVTKQTAERKNGGYRIDSLDENQLVYFIAECLRNAADAVASYE